MDDGDSSCDYCGVDIDDETDDYIGLRHFSVNRKDHGGLIFEPDEDPCLVTDWPDILPIKMVHLNCISNYFDGIHASIPTREREAGHAEDGE